MAHRRVWKVSIASASDEQLRDRFYFGEKRHLLIIKLPVRGEYLIEARGVNTAQKKALRLALEDGIENPVVKSVADVAFDNEFTQ